MIDADGRVIARRRVDNDASGFAELLAMLAEAGDLSDQPTGGFALSGAARGVGGESDAADAVLLANIVRTDADAHRPLPPADTELAQVIRVLARAQQDAVWARQQVGNQSRDLLKDFYPAAIAAFADLRDGGLARRDARTSWRPPPPRRKPRN